MIVMLFTVSSTLKALRKSWKMNLLIVLTLFTAYLFFFLVCCYIEDGLRGLSSFQLRNMEHSLLYRGQVSHSMDKPSVSRDDILALLGNAGVQSFTVVEYDTYDDPVTGQGYSLYLVDENFAQHVKAPIVAGRYFTQRELLEGASVCVTNQQSVVNGGPGPGEIITLGGLKLTVIGVMKYVPNAGVKLVPYRALLDHRSSNFQVQRYHAALQYADAPPSIDWPSLELDGQLLTGREYYESGRRSLFGRSTAILAAGLFILAYALLNLINILINKLDQQQKNLGIRVALGASYQQIFGQFFLECLALVLAAVTLVFASEAVVGPVAGRYFNHYFGSGSVLSMLTVSVVSAGLISWRLFRRFRKMGIAEIIKKL